jgi:EAL domain-containing protein (putative c-di-GMP-specific phosphodiesterase class I)
MAQPIFGVRGDVYHEILLRLEGDDGETIPPDCFLPIAHEFGLSSSIDMWVIENTLKFMAQNREKCPPVGLPLTCHPRRYVAPDFRMTSTSYWLSTRLKRGS